MQRLSGVATGCHIHGASVTPDSDDDVLMKLKTCMIATLCMLGGPVFACGPVSDCLIEDGHYRIRMPQGEPVGAIVFAHGYRGSERGTMNNKSLARLAERLNVALVAIKSAADDWTLPGAPSAGQRRDRDETAYVGRVVDDVVERFGIAPDAFMATGFSAGGMLVWTLACNDSTRFRAFVPLSGTFWQPEPLTCLSPPANIVHYHGTSDRIVPLTGRPIGPGHQGDVPKVLDMYRAYGGYDTPATTKPLDGLACAGNRNGDGKLVELCTFEGGHGFKAAYIERAWTMFMDEQS